MIALAVVSVVYGAVTWLVFRRLTDPDALRVAANRILAHVIALRLFVDEPRLVLREQFNLVVGNARLLRLIAVPMLVAGLIFGLAYYPMDRRFGHRELGRGENAVLTLPLGSDPQPSSASSSFIVETPPVRIPRLNQVSWRIRITQPTSRFTQTVTLHGFAWQLWFLILSAAAGLAGAGLAGAGVHSGMRRT